LGASELKGATKFKYSELKAATRNFSEKNILGEGGFGAVYKVNKHELFREYFILIYCKLHI